MFYEYVTSINIRTCFVSTNALKISVIRFSSIPHYITTHVGYHFDFPFLYSNDRLF